MGSKTQTQNKTNEQTKQKQMWDTENWLVIKRGEEDWGGQNR